MSVMLDCVSVPFVRCGTISRLGSDGTNSGSKECKGAMVAPMVGSGGVYFWWKSGVRRSVLC
jgi:hypothetical protein